MKKVAMVIGTRPEAIKMLPLYKELKKSPVLEVSLVSTGQHRDMLQGLFHLFEVTPDLDLDIMTKGQTLTGITVKILSLLTDLFEKEKPDLLLVHGDTTTALASAMAGFYAGIEVGHIEAGLRTYRLDSPFPEEFNRQVVDRIAKYQFAPTESSKVNLQNEVGNQGVQIFVTGNTVIDALLEVASKVEVLQVKPYILITGHRRENFGGGFERLCRAIRRIAQNHREIDIVYPVHLNPNVQEVVYRMLGEEPNVKLVKPMEYKEFVQAMFSAKLIITDSGGVQEEAPSLGVPVLVTRDTTERPEAVEAGTVKLVGTDEEVIVAEVERLLSDKEAYNRMAQATNPYGDGNACKRIREAIEGLYDLRRG